MKNILISILTAITVLSGCNNAEKKIYESENYRHAGEMVTEHVKPGLSRQVLCYNDDIMLVKVISFSPALPIVIYHERQI
jgi:hypothetical protein